jgi:GNAT superfamily N-acetyltransferase
MTSPNFDMLNFREQELPQADYDALYDVPEDVKNILDIYEGIDGRSGVYRVERANELLDKFVDQQCFIAEESDEDELVVQAVANYRASQKSNYGFIEGLAVHPESRGRGIGGFVINQLVQVAANDGLAELRLRSVPRAVPLYQRHQFVIIDGDENESHPVMSRLI